ncbi:MAG TPA: hypothetical protein VFM94_11705 [Solirubrobacterales bacterium]|nr:hypothetical protein [Solirubrobacterales bacterium]
MNEQIDLAEFLVIAERVLDVDAKTLKSAAKLDAAESALAAPFMGFGDTLFYPDPAHALRSSARGSFATTHSPTATSARVTSVCACNSKAPV